MDVEVLQRSLDRERKRRDQAERLLEEKSRELFYSYRQLEETLTELEANKDQLVQSEKMASLGVMAAGVAHEINNPVGFVSSNLNSLGEYLDVLCQLAARVEHYLGDPGDSARCALAEFFKSEDVPYLVEDSADLIKESREGLSRVQDIVAGLRTFSRSSDGDREAVDLADCLANTLPIARSQFGSHCDFEVRVGELPQVTGNSGRLSQVFLNLLVNAAQAVAGQSEPRVVLEAEPLADAVELRISDNGCGIPEEHIDKLFQPFFTTKPVGEGTGLGLSISHGIVEEHGGQIFCESRVGVGTTFRVTLPLVAPGAC